MDRAAAVQPSFKLTELNASAVAQICQRLDGIPLAIELAAARVKMLQTAEIAARLDDRFMLLTSGSRTALPRHQTLRAAIDWSYDSLTEPERVLLRRLSVFAGGCSLTAAEHVCADDDHEGIFSKGILNLLTLLVAKSLVFVDMRSSETRYQLLDTIRQYGREKLLVSQEDEHLRGRHLDFFLKFAEEAEPELYGADQVAWLNRLERERENMRAAIAWSLASEARVGTALKLVGALGKFWEMRGYFREGREYLSETLSKIRDRNTTAYAKALFAAGNLAFEQSDFLTARDLLAQSASMYRELGPASNIGLATSLRVGGYAVTEMGEYSTALPLLKESLDIMRELKFDRGIAEALRQLGWYKFRTGALDDAAMAFEEALPLARKIGNHYEMSIVLSGLADVVLYQGDIARAAALEEESLRIAREIGYTWRVPAALGSLAWIAIRQGELEKAAAMLGESVTLRREMGERGGTAWCLEQFAEIAMVQAKRESSSQRTAQLERAAQLYGAAASLRAAIGSTVDLADRPEYERHLDLLQRQLPQTAFHASWKEGHTMTLEQAIEYALEPAIPREQLMKQAFGGLTERERQVAMLIAHGKSNREIAEEMTVGVKTVETYVTRILNKLGFDSRVQIATWIMEKAFEGKEPQ